MALAAANADLFQRHKSVISRHIKNVFDEGELVRAAVVAEFATTADAGKAVTVYSGSAPHRGGERCRPMRLP